MSIENIENNNHQQDPSERGMSSNDEKFDAEGSPRQTWILGPDDEVFYGSEKERDARQKEKRSDK